jgi:hypothetical protein
MVASWSKFYTNLVSLYNQHQYPFDHIWNNDEIGVHESKQVGAWVLSKRGSNEVYNTIPKSQEWLIINCIINVAHGSLLGFYIFRGD